ncbi:hypothetical protein [Salsipaludibacter albus]|uniref:hypothetical protein n=1 Tax=Salsipaludibacter albus TaxID=2849650 RepID=UPI001EE4C682|nr:hypothetical protein [Salsipaludibacter albus]MBY5161342.1 hypothetical protein [Salsipaludibacter albus]
MSDDLDGDDQSGRDPVSFGSSTPPAEWAMAGVGALLAIVLVTVLVVVGLTTRREPPGFELRVTEVSVVDADTSLVRVDVSNVGGAPAEAVLVEGHRTDDPGPPSRAEVDHLSAGSMASVGLFFTGPRPEPDDLDLRVVGFRHP